MKPQKNKLQSSAAKLKPGWKCHVLVHFLGFVIYWINIINIQYKETRKYGISGKPARACLGRIFHY